jgi:hypothetical protein
MHPVSIKAMRSLIRKFVAAAVSVFAIYPSGSITHGQTYRIVEPGVEHAEVVHMIGTDPVKVQILRLDPTKVRLDVVHAADKAIGLETTSSIAKRHGAVAAVNAGFFRLDRSIFAGDAAGLLLIDGVLLSEVFRERAAVGISNGRNRTSVEFGHYRTVAAAEFGVNGQLFFDGINRERKPGEVVLYTPEFGETTLASAEGTEVLLSNCGLPRDGRRKCEGAESAVGQAGARIPANGYVISIGKEALPRASGMIELASGPKTKPKLAGNAIRITTEIVSTDPKRTRAMFEDMTNGVSMLLRGGKVDLTWEQESAGKAFAENRHPRTAIGKSKDGRIILLTADGRQPGTSVGMSLRELADLLLSIGVVDAMNLDGGGSTTMVVAGQVVNKPSDKEGERKIGDAIIVKLRR